LARSLRSYFLVFLPCLALETKSATVASSCHLALWPQQAAGRPLQRGALLRGVVPTDLPLPVAPRSTFPSDVSTRACGENALDNMFRPPPGGASGPRRRASRPAPNGRFDASARSRMPSHGLVEVRRSPHRQSHRDFNSGDSLPGVDRLDRGHAHLACRRETDRLRPRSKIAQLAGIARIDSWRASAPCSSPSMMP